jgi:glycosyltransferase involved in cell wall biosynthesis
MRILHITDRLSDRGGAYRHLQGIAAWLAAHGHDVHVAAGRDEGALFAGQRHVVPGVEAREARPVELGPLVAAVRPDVVHVHTVVNPCVLEWARMQSSVVTVQDHRYFCPTRGKWKTSGEICRDAMQPDVCAACIDDEAYRREALALTETRRRALAGQRVLVLSRYMERELRTVGVDAQVIPPFVHGLDLAATSNGRPCVLFVGRLAEHKGPRDAVEIWRRAGIELPLLMAGTGPLRDELASAGAEVLGWMDPGALSRTYRRARAVVMPSRWQEPFGIAGLEAMAMGVPVVAWDSGGMGEWHPGPLPPWGDLDAAAAALKIAVGRRVDSPSGFDVDTLMAELVAVYEGVR